MSISRKIPFIRQKYQSDCGICCAAMILSYYKVKVGLGDLRKSFNVSRDGINLLDMKGIFEKYGMEVHVYKAELNAIEVQDCPAVLYWDKKHFVVLKKITNEKIIIMDPQIGEVAYSIQEAETHFSNYVLLCKPLENSKSATVYRKKLHLKENKRFLLFGTYLVLLSFMQSWLILRALVKVSNYIDKVAIQGTSQGLGSWFVLGVNVLLILACEIVKNKKIKTNMDQYCKEIVKRQIQLQVYNVPYWRLEGIDNREFFQVVQNIQDISEKVEIGLFRGIFIITSSIVYGAYVFPISCRGAVIFLLYYIVICLLLLGVRKYLNWLNIKYKHIAHELYKEQQEMFFNWLNVKVMGIESVYQQRVADGNQMLSDGTKKMQSCNEWYLMIRKAILYVLTPIMFYLVFVPIIKESLLIGKILLYLLCVEIITLFVVTIIDSIDMIKYVFLNILNIKEAAENNVCEEQGNFEHEIQGNIQLKNVSYSYWFHNHFALDNISLQIKAGDKVVIVGNSGAGKTTLGKMLVGLYNPVAGEVLYDGINRRKLKIECLRKQMGVLISNHTLIHTSIFENIQMKRDYLKEEDIESICKLLAIDKEIKELPLRYNTVIANEENNISSGLKRKILLARILVDNPKIVLLDDVFSLIDISIQRKISKKLKEDGCTQIIIDNNFCSVYDAEKILVMDSGKIVECGIHQELEMKDGVYKKLWKDHMLNNLQ